MKIYNSTKIPSGLGYDDVDYDAIYQSGYSAGYQAGYDDYICPEPPERLCWLEDMEGNQLIRGVITLPMTGGLASVKIVCNSDDIEWSFGDQFSPFGSFLVGTGTTVISKQIGQGPQGPDFYVWQPLRSTNANVVPGSAVRITYEGLTPNITFECNAIGPVSAITSGYAYYNTYSPTPHFIIAANTGWTFDYVEEITGVKDLSGFPAQGMGGYHSLFTTIPVHDGPRRYVFTAYFTDTMEPVKNIVIEQIVRPITSAITFGASGGTKEIDMEDTGTWSVNTSDFSWAYDPKPQYQSDVAITGWTDDALTAITITPVYGTDDKFEVTAPDINNKLIYTADRNGYEASQRGFAQAATGRKGTVKVNYGGKEQEVTITQKIGYGKEGSQNAPHFPPTGGSIEVFIEAYSGNDLTYFTMGPAIDLSVAGMYRTNESAMTVNFPEYNSFSSVTMGTVPPLWDDDGNIVDYMPTYFGNPNMPSGSYTSERRTYFVIERPRLNITKDLPNTSFPPYGTPNVPAAGGIYTFTVSANDNFHITLSTFSGDVRTEDLVLSATGGSADQETTITLTVPENTTGGIRAYVIEFLTDYRPFDYREATDNIYYPIIQES